MDKMFSEFVVKAITEDKREIVGIASTPTIDRVKDIVDPMGLTFQSEAPLLLGHDHSQPVGTVIPVEINPIVAQFIEEGKTIPAQQGEFQVSVTENRKLAAITVVSEELLRFTDGVAERLIANMIIRSLSRGMDAVLVGDQVRDEAKPQGLANFAPQAAGFEAGLESFTEGDLTNAAVIVNPITAVGLRSEAEQGITAAGGTYKGFPVITSIGVPVGKLFIVDGSRILAYLGGAEVMASTAAGITLNSGDTVPMAMSGSGSVAIRALQYADWSLVPGAAVEVTLN
jgi:hypothetical protein